MRLIPSPKIPGQLVIYVSGPYTKGDRVLHSRRAILYGDKLLREGHIPIIPHLTLFWHLLSPGDYEQWINYDLEMIAFAHELHRLDGESSGGDREVGRALENGIPVHMKDWQPE